MTSRMDRYQDTKEKPRVTSRREKNQNLYQDFYNKTRFTEVKELDERPVIDLSQLEMKKQTRENYHKLKEFEDLIVREPQKKKDDLSVFFQEDENKVYDINSILLEAKKNREEIDELEKKRRLRNTEYNILANLKPNEVEEYKQKIMGKKQELEEETDSLQELINTITSKSMRKDIDKLQSSDDNNELLSDLLPKDQNETIITESISKEILAREQEKTKTMSIEQPPENEIDRSFYTKSMDLSDKDFEMDDEFVEKEKNSSVIVFFKILIAIILVVGIAILVFYLMNKL